MRTHPEFSQLYARAKEDAADAMAEDILDIADDGTNDYMEDPETGEEKVNHENIQRSKLRVEARKWIAAKLKPKRYGDKVHQEISGSLSLEQLLGAAETKPK